MKHKVNELSENGIVFLKDFTIKYRREFAGEFGFRDTFELVSKGRGTIEEKLLRFAQAMIAESGEKNENHRKDGK